MNRQFTYLSTGFYVSKSRPSGRPSTTPAVDRGRIRPRLGSGLDRPPMEVGPFARPVSAVHPTRGGAYALPRADMFLGLRPNDASFASEPASGGPWLYLDTNQQLTAKPAALHVVYSELNRT